MERIISARLNSWLEDNNKFSPAQYGFRSSRGTADTVFSLVNDLYEARDRGNAVLACFVDVRKAFDSIHHGELIARIKNMGIHPVYANWLISYLCVICKFVFT